MVELLIVMAVIAVLIGIAIPSFKGMQYEAKRTKAFTNLKMIKLAVEVYGIKAGSYPPIWGTKGTSFEAAITEPPYGGTVLEAVPKNPFSSNPASTTALARYQLSDNGIYYAIWYTGPNGINDVSTILDSGQVCEGVASDDIGITNGKIPAGTNRDNWKY